MAENAVKWRDDLLGVAYRYYDLRMNIVPLFDEMSKVTDLWNDTCHWWVDHSIRARFIESGDKYWFAIGSESTRPDTNVFLCKELPISENYERFKKGHDGEAYLRLGTYEKKYFENSKDDAVCDCEHEQEDHDEKDYSCLYEDCFCTKFQSFQIRIAQAQKNIGVRSCRFRTYGKPIFVTGFYEPRPYTMIYPPVASIVPQIGNFGHLIKEWYDVHP